MKRTIIAFLLFGICTGHAMQIASEVSPDVAPESLPFWYQTKMKVWQKISTVGFEAASSSSTANPLNTAESERGSELISWAEFDQRTPFPHVYTAKSIPEKEKTRFSDFSSNVIDKLMRFIPLSQKRLPSIPSDPEALLKFFPASFEKIIPRPVLPRLIKEGVEKGDVLAAVALAGPFADYITAKPKMGAGAGAGDNGEKEKTMVYTIDLSHYESLPVKNGLMPLGGKATLEYDAVSQQMRTVSIQYLGYDHGPGGVNWLLAQKALLGALSTDLIVVHHLVNTHLSMAGTLAAVTYGELDYNHSIRVLLHPHISGTIALNNTTIKLLCGHEYSFLPIVSSYHHGDALALINGSVDKFDIRRMDFAENLALRGFDPEDLKISYPYAENSGSFWKIIGNYVGNYVDAYYENDEMVSADAQLSSWYNQLDKYIPNGIKGYAPILNKGTLKKLLTTSIFTTSVEHENVGNMTFNYGFWQQYIPMQIPTNGSLIKIDAFNAFTDLTVLTTASTAKLTEDFSSLAIDEKGKEVMKTFRQALIDYEKTLTEKEAHTIVPSAVESAVRA